MILLLRLLGLSLLLLDHLVGPATATVISMRPAYGEVGLLLLMIFRFKASVLLVQVLVMNDNHGRLAGLLFCVIISFNNIGKLASMGVNCSANIVCLLCVAVRN